MYCIYLQKKSNVVFWFSLKAGCTYIKSLYLQYLDIDTIWPHQLPEENLKETNLTFNGEITSPFHVLFIRNPYKRIVSGFLDKLTWKPDFPDDKPSFNQSYCIPNEINFEQFVETLDDHSIFKDNHFSPQTAGAYHPKIRFNKIYDIENIDRGYLDSLFQTTANEPRYKGYFSMYQPYEGLKPAYKLSIDEINQLDFKPHYQQFYTPRIKQKVEQLFARDFLFFEHAGFTFKL